MMGRTKIWVVAAALALLPGAALAQQDAELAPNAAEEVVSTVSDGGAAATYTPQRPVPGFGQPDGGWNIQNQVTTLGAEARDMNDNLLLPLMAVVTLIVFVLLLFAMVRYRARRNPVPSRTSHHTLIEVLWTVTPVLILVWIAIPSFRLLANQYDPPRADLTIKATGHQWYWSYEYPDQGGFAFDAIMLSDEEAARQRLPRLLATDNRVVVPVGATVKMLVTASDVIHSWAIPAFWVKMDAVPGRINETWFKADRPGVYYGQCSELCGTRHGFMPIAVEVVQQEEFDAWVAARQAEFGIDPASLDESAAAPAALR